MGVLKVYKKAFKILNPHIYYLVRVSITIYGVVQSGRRELNPGPLAPHASALAGLRHAPISELPKL
jgi:hypothetical protein